ncbi:MAG TPA: nucleoside phosphorylase-like protein [Pirellulales bacterium]|nr:nucleoside phosphorylase-like protein [Pirellulales bacterium]
MPFEKIKDPKLGEYHWLGPIGNETVIAVRPSRESGQLIMGSIGRQGSAAKAIRFQEATGANGIMQLGMAFGVNPSEQQLGDVLVSTALIPYDNREIVHGSASVDDCIVDYSQALPQRARQVLVDLLVREKQSQVHPYGVHVGVILSGSARFRCARFRDELVASVPAGKDPVIGGEMEVVGLLAASATSSAPIWCVVKGISDFGDKERDHMIAEGRAIACRNAADFVLSALANDAPT